MIKLTSKQKEEIRKGAERNNQTMSAYVLDRTLNPRVVTSESPEMLEMLKKNFAAAREKQVQQQVTMYIILQFVMRLNLGKYSHDEIMEFYHEHLKKANERFGGGN